MTSFLLLPNTHFHDCYGLDIFTPKNRVFLPGPEWSLGDHQYKASQASFELSSNATFDRPIFFHCQKCFQRGKYRIVCVGHLEKLNKRPKFADKENPGAFDSDNKTSSNNNREVEDDPENGRKSKNSQDGKNSKRKNSKTSGEAVMNVKKHRGRQKKKQHSKNTAENDGKKKSGAGKSKKSGKSKRKAKEKSENTTEIYNKLK